MLTFWKTIDEKRILLNISWSELASILSEYSPAEYIDILTKLENTYKK